MTIDDVMKQTFDSLKVDTHIYAEFEYQGGMYSGEFKVIWIDKERNCVSLTTPNESPYGTCIGVPLKNFFSLVNISNTNKEETNMTDYGRKLEKEYRDGMAVGAIYDFMGRNTYGLMRGYTFAGFDGCGEDLKLNFINERTNTPYQIYASDIGRCSLTSTPRPKWLKYAKPGDKFRLRYRDINIDNNIVCNTWYFKKYEYITNDIVISFTWDPNDQYIEHTIKLSNIICAEKLTCENCLKPMKLVKKVEVKVESGLVFHEDIFYKYTNEKNFFRIKVDGREYDCLYMSELSSNNYIGFAYTDINDTDSGTMYLDINGLANRQDNGSLEYVWKSDEFVIETYHGSPIPIEQIFNKKEKLEEKLEWDIEKLKVGKAYRIQNIDGNETDGIYRFLYEPTIPGQSSIVFAVVSDKGIVGTCHVYQEELVSGKIKIYELACRKETDAE